MATNLVYAYNYDWRIRMKLFRFHVDSAAFRTMQSNAVRNNAMYAFALMAVSAFALRANVYVASLLSLVGIAMLLKAFFLHKSRHIAKFGLRSTLRSQPAQAVEIDIHADGIAERVNQIHSSATWDEVTGYFLHRGIIGIQIKQTRWALIPRHGLTPTSNRFEDIQPLLQSKGIPQITNRDAPSFEAI